MNEREQLPKKGDASQSQRDLGETFRREGMVASPDLAKTSLLLKALLTAGLLEANIENLKCSLGPP